MAAGVLMITYTNCKTLERTAHCVCGHAASQRQTKILGIYTEAQPQYRQDVLSVGSLTFCFVCLLFVKSR